MKVGSRCDQGTQSHGQAKARRDRACACDGGDFAGNSAGAVPSGGGAHDADGRGAGTERRAWVAAAMSDADRDAVDADAVSADAVGTDALVKALGRTAYEPTWRAMQAFTAARDATTPGQ